MPPDDGDPAEAWDTWLRVITDEKYWKSDGTLSNNAFSGKRVISPPALPRPWSMELSGDLLSMIADLRSHADEFCGNKFNGYMYQKVENLRVEENATDVALPPRVVPTLMRMSLPTILILNNSTRSSCFATGSRTSFNV
jgi:hypothetical protein